jgi:photosystem II stability/assembly factor-like uncharacterized protein
MFNKLTTSYLFFFLSFVIFFCSIGYTQVQWHIQNSGTNTTLFDIHFTDASNGWVAGNTGLILHTSDGGVNWGEQVAPPNNTYYSIFFIDDQNGWAGGYAGKLIRTTDGGNTWIDGTAGTNRYRYDLYFINPDSGWVVGGDQGTFPTFIEHREIYFTSDGGVTWISQYAESDEAPLHAVTFTSSTNGFAVGGVGPIMHTTDGGNSWAEETTLTAYELRDVYFTNSSNGWIIGHYLGLPHVPAIFNTTDGGATWNEQTFGVDESLSSVSFSDELNGWAVGGASGPSNIMYTTDGGVNWDYHSSPTDNFLLKVFFIENNVGWAVGLDGTIITTANPVSVNENLTQPVGYDLFQNFPNPFNPGTSISFSISEASIVKLTVYDALGEKIGTLVSGKLNGGSYSYDWNASKLPSGIYFYRLQAGSFVETKKMVLMK